MSETQATIDLVRWTFTAEADKAQEIRDYLVEEGLEVLIDEGVHFSVLWDEANREEIEEVVDEVWAINGVACEITHEEFSRQVLESYTAEDDPTAEAA